MNLFRGLRPLQRAAALRDALAGVVMAAMDIPQVLGYSKIAGMPVVTGLYSLLLPLVAFAAFGSSRYLVVAADSATAAIFADGVSGTATPASAQYIALACIVAVLTAIILLLARLLRLGFIADFLSRTVLVGFLTGVGFQVGISVLSEMLGVPVDSRRPVVQLWEVGRGLPHAHLPTVVLSVSVLAFVLLLRRLRSQGAGRAGGCCGCDCGERGVEFCGTRNCDDWAGGRRFAAPGIDGAAQPSRDEPQGNGVAAHGVGLVRRDDSYAERGDRADLCGETLPEGEREYRSVRAFGCECRGGAERRVCGEWQPHADGDDGGCRRAEPDGAGDNGGRGGRGAAVSHRAAPVSSHMRAGRTGVSGCAAAHRFERARGTSGRRARRNMRWQ